MYVGIRRRTRKLANKIKSQSQGSLRFRDWARLLLSPPQKLANCQVESLGRLHAADMTHPRHDDKASHPLDLRRDGGLDRREGASEDRVGWICI